MNFNEGTISDHEGGPFSRFDEGIISDSDDFLVNWMDMFRMTKFNDGFLSEPETDSHDEGDGSISDQSITDDEANWQSPGSGGSAAFTGPSGSSVTDGEGTDGTDGEGTDGTGTDDGGDHTTDDEGSTTRWQPNLSDGDSTESSLHDGHSSGFTQSEGDTSGGEWTDTDDEFIEVGIETNIINAVSSFFRK